MAASFVCGYVCACCSFVPLGWLIEADSIEAVLVVIARVASLSSRRRLRYAHSRSDVALQSRVALRQSRPDAASATQSARCLWIRPRVAAAAGGGEVGLRQRAAAQGQQGQ